MDRDSLRAFEQANCINCITFYAWWDCSIWLAAAEGADTREIVEGICQRQREMKKCRED